MDGHRRGDHVFDAPLHGADDGPFAPCFTCRFVGVGCCPVSNAFPVGGDAGDMHRYDLLPPVSFAGLVGVLLETRLVEIFDGLSFGRFTTRIRFGIHVGQW